MAADMLRRGKAKGVHKHWNSLRASLSLRNLFHEGRPAQGDRGLLGEEGATLVEMAVSSVVLFAILIGIIEVSLGLYSYNFVADGARQATRWAMVRGSTSCVNTPNLTHCNAASTDIQNYVKGLGYPGLSASNLTITPTWLTASATTPTTWSTCSSGTCNLPGNEVQVQVTYAFPIGIPFWTITSINVSSTSSMVISQ